MANDVVVRPAAEIATSVPEVMNPQTGEIVTQDPYVGISQLALTMQECDRLREPIPVEDLDILPTGEVYASQVRYRRILNEVFGPGSWALRPMSDPKVQGQTIMRLYALYVRGAWVSEAPGECDYQPNNPRMSYATALEAAKSNALTRCCKDLGIASECWDKRFCEQFKKDHCVQQNGKWKRKDAVTTTATHQQQEPTGDGISEAQRRRAFAIWAKAGHDNDDVRAWLKAKYGYASTNDILRKDYEAICSRLEDPAPLNDPGEPPTTIEVEPGEVG